VDHQQVKYGFQDLLADHVMLKIGTNLVRIIVKITEKIRANEAKSEQSPIKRFNQIRYRSQEKELSSNLTLEEYKNINNPCYYCNNRQTCYV
jgi:hypothetical protein